jgi:hypothetical protein
VSFSNPHHHLHHLHVLIRHELPFFNRDTEQDRNLERWLAHVQRPLADVTHAARAVHDAAFARHLLQLLSFLVSSFERHCQANGEPAGHGLRTLGLEAALIHLGHTASHAPRDSHYTYFIENPQPLTFTGTAFETAYIRAMQHTHHLHDVAASALRALAAEHHTVTPQAVHDAVRFALSAEERLATLCESFIEESAYRLDDVHDVHLPSYLVSYPIGGELTHGPDPHHIASAIEVAILTGAGAHDGPLHGTHHDHFAHLDHHDRARLETAARHAPLGAELFEHASVASSFHKLRDAIHANARHFESIQAICHRDAHHVHPHHHQASTGDAHATV